MRSPKHKNNSIHSYKSKWALSHQIAPFMHSTTFQRIQDIRCIPLSAPKTSRALLSCLSWCVHSSVAGTGASADLRSRSPFPPDVTFGPAPSLRVRILLQLQQPISSLSSHSISSLFACIPHLHQNLMTIPFPTIANRKRRSNIYQLHISFIYDFQSPYAVGCQ